MTDDLKLKVTLSADGKQLSSSLRSAQGEVSGFGAKAAQAGDVAAGAFGKTRQGVESISTQLQKAQGAVLAFIGVSQGLSAIGSLIAAADGYGEMAERIRMATTSTEDYEQVQKRLQETAGGTYRALSEAQELYIRTADALRALGYNTAQQLDITDSLSYSFVANATSADKASSAINAFSRSIQTGKVSAEDWQSLLMATPSIVSDIAAATGKSSAEIRALGVQGKLGLGELTEGLRLARDGNQALADNMNTTVADALTRLRTNFSVFVGEANQSSGATYKLADAIIFVAENIQTVAVAAIAAGTVATARLAVGMTVATVATAVKARGEVAATAAALAHARAQVGLLGAHGAVAAAEAAHTAALGRLAAAQGVATVSARGLVSVLTGPIGLAVTAAAVAVSFMSWGDNAKSAAAGSDLLKQSVDELTAAQARQRLQQMEGGFKQAQADVEQLTGKVKAYKVMLDTVSSAQEKAFWSQQLIDAEGNLSTATQKVAEYNQVQQRLNDIMSQRADIAAPAFVDPEAEKAIAQILAGLQQQYLQLTLNEEQYVRHQMAMAGASQEQIAQAVAIARATAALKQQQTAQETAAKIIKDAQEAQAKAAASAAAAQDEWVWSMIDAIDPTLALQEQISDLQDAWADGLFGDLSADKFNKYIDDLKKKMAELNGVKIQDPAKQLGTAMQTTAGGIKDVAGAMQGMYEQGSRGYQEMAVAMQAANVVAAVGAVLEQGRGDPYTAWARMAAMAAAVTALGVQIGMMGGGWSDDAAIQQAKQGTGTVLGDSGAKSESIAHSVDITAQATSQLVGINRDMLRALQAMQAGITGATVRIAQGAKNVDFGHTYRPKNVFDLSANIGDFMTTLPGLKQLDQLSLGGFSGSFAKLEEWLGGSSKVTDQGIEIVGGTLGALIEDVVVGAYQVTKTKKYKWSSAKSRTDVIDLGDDISTQFSLVFESLADSVYAGAVALGLSSDEVERKINEYTIATQKISTKGLSAEDQQKELEAVFSSIFDGLAGSVVTFLPKFQKAGEGLGETLARVATHVQVTEEAAKRLGFAAQRLGAEQFADLSMALVEAAGGLEQFIGGMSGFVDKFAPDAHKFDLVYEDLRRALSEAGLSVPPTRDAMWGLMQSLDAGTEAGRKQIATLLRVTDTADNYYKLLDEQQSKILASFKESTSGKEFENYFSQLASWISAESKSIESDYKARIDLLNKQKNLSEQLAGYITSLKLSELSPLDSGQKFTAAGDAFAKLLVRAQGGDLDAASQLQAAAKDYLTSADGYYGRSSAYTSIFNDVIAQLESLGLQFGAASTEEKIAQLTQSQLAEQQALRALAAQEVEWAARHYDKLGSVEAVLNALPSNIAAVLRGDAVAPSAPAQPVRPEDVKIDLSGLDFSGVNFGGIGVIDVSGMNFGLGGLNLSGWNGTFDLGLGFNGSHADGLANVPFDGYVAQLHKGEAVLTASENRALSQFDTAPLLAELSALRNEVSRLRIEAETHARAAQSARSSQLQAARDTARAMRPQVKA